MANETKKPAYNSATAGQKIRDLFDEKYVKEIKRCKTEALVANDKRFRRNLTVKQSEMIGLIEGRLYDSIVKEIHDRSFDDEDNALETGTIIIMYDDTVLFDKLEIFGPFVKAEKPAKNYNEEGEDEDECGGCENCPGCICVPANSEYAENRRDFKIVVTGLVTSWGFHEPEIEYYHNDTKKTKNLFIALHYRLPKSYNGLMSRFQLANAMDQQNKKPAMMPPIFGGQQRTQIHEGLTPIEAMNLSQAEMEAAMLQRANLGL
jgi:hypothetical protein